MTCIWEGSFYIGSCEAWSCQYITVGASPQIQLPVSLGLCIIKGACVTFQISLMEQNACSEFASHSACQEVLHHV